MPTDFTSTAGGDGIVKADAFQSSFGITSPKVVVSGTVTFDPPSLATGVFALSSAIPVTGVALGDAVELFPPYDTQGIMYLGSPSSAGNIKISLINASAGTVDLASGSWGVVVKRRV